VIDFWKMCLGRHSRKIDDGKALRLSGNTAELSAEIARSRVTRAAECYSPTRHSLRERASARITAAFGVRHAVASAAAMPQLAATNGNAT
jgi:hypothetical protein